MLKLAFAAILVTGLGAVGPAFAETNDSGIGRGCTLNPFDHTMRCIDFDNCTTDKNGKKTCPVVVTPTKVHGSGGSDPQPYLAYKLNDAMISSWNH